MDQMDIVQFWLLVTYALKAVTRTFLPKIYLIMIDMI